MRLGEKFPLKAGLVTSLGFGHVSGLIALVHPQAFLAALSAEERADYTRRAQERVLAGQRRLASAIAGGRPMYEKPADRRFDHDQPEKRQEAAMLLDPASRLATVIPTCARGSRAAIVGVGIDVVSIPDFAEQVDQPGTVFAATFTPVSVATRPTRARWPRGAAARWAAKEAVIKAWSGSRFAQRPVLPEGIHRDIEVITDVGPAQGPADRRHRRAPGRRADPRLAHPRG